MKKVSNEVFNEAYNNIDNKKIINRVKKMYRNNIPKEDLDDCGLYALWHALIFHKDEKGKFTSTLYKMVNWKCNAYVKKNNKPVPTSLDDTNLSYSQKFYDEFEDYISILPKDLAEIVEQRIVQKKTITQIGKERNIGFDAAKSKINKAYRMLRKHVDRTILK
jgi:DNA-directed RNA polymerase specialized sigma24 family protein